MIKLNKIKKPTAIYAEVIEDGAMTQFVDTMNQPSSLRGALMPDAHQGYTLPIGGVVETDNMIMPSYIGFDTTKNTFANDTEAITAKLGGSNSWTESNLTTSNAPALWHKSQTEIAPTSCVLAVIAAISSTRPDL